MLARTLIACKPRVPGIALVSEPGIALVSESGIALLLVFDTVGTSTIRWKKYSTVPCLRLWEAATTAPAGSIGFATRQRSVPCQCDMTCTNAARDNVT